MRGRTDGACVAIRMAVTQSLSPNRSCHWLSMAFIQFVTIQLLTLDVEERLPLLHPSCWKEAQR